MAEGRSSGVQGTIHVLRSRSRGSRFGAPRPMAAPYEQRDSRGNLLYQLIETHFDTFEQVYDEAFSQEYGLGRTTRPGVGH